MTPNEEILSLKKQLNKERRKNRILREKLDRRVVSDTDLGEDAPDSFLSRAGEAHLFHHRGYVGYLAALVRRNSVYRLWKKYVGYFRRIRLVSVTLRIFSYVFLLLQTGTVFFIILLLLLVVLPILAAVALVAYLIALLLMRRDNKKMSTLCKAKNIYVFFPRRTEEFSRGNFWKGNILSFAEQPDARVIVVSPYVFSGKGMGEKGNYYFNFRRESKHLYFIRKHYFFALRRRVLSECRGRITLIY